MSQSDSNLNSNAPVPTSPNDSIVQTEQNQTESVENTNVVSNESIKGRRRVTISEIEVTNNLVDRRNSNKRMKRVGFDLDESFKVYVERRDRNNVLLMT